LFFLAEGNVYDDFLAPIGPPQPPQIRFMNKKVLCIDNKHPVYRYDSDVFYLTIGKWYKLMRIIDKGYEVINDCHTTVLYDKTLFKTVEQIREDKINQIISNG
jgi:hypothetical protein